MTEQLSKMICAFALGGALAIVIYLAGMMS
jgi:hypothetical protein